MTKPLSFHISNLKNNNINLSSNQIKRILQKVREIKYPLDQDFLEDISKITITFENENNMENLNFCWKDAVILNPSKKYIDEKCIIFTTNFQMNLMTKCKQIYIDGTFKSAPKKFYQILNFAGYYKDINGIIPIFMILMTGKNEYLYNKVLQDLKSILKDNGIDLKSIPKRFMVDFEQGLINSIKKNFENSTIDGCFFHFVKLLWNKAKLLGLCKSGKLKMTKILIFMLKIIPFIEYDDRQNFFEKNRRVFFIK